MNAQQATLRQMDWRFLVPAPPGGAFQHLLLFGGDARLAETIRAQGIARRVSCDVRGAQGADAAIVLPSADSELERAAARLEAGGVLYCAARDVRLPQRVHASGLCVLGSYFVLPNFEHAEAFIPMAPRAIYDWYGTTLERRAASSWLKSAWRRASSAHHLAVTAIRGAERAAPISVLGHPAMPSELRQPGVHSIVLTRGDALNRVAFFPFAPNSALPLAVVKTSRVAERKSATVHEQNALRRIRKCLDAKLSATIPEPRGLLYWNDLAVGIESCAPGQSLAVLLEGRDVSSQTQVENLNLVMDWLCAFHRQARAENTIWNEKQFARWVAQPIARYRNTFGVNAEEQVFFDELAARGRTLLGTPLPTVWNHWGLELRNIFRADGQVTVIDWEGGSAGLPLFDLIYLATQWYVRARGARRNADAVRALQELYLDAPEANALARAIRAAIARYVRAMDIAPPFVPLLIALMWILRALGRAARQNEIAPSAASVRAGNVYTQYVELLARHREDFLARTYSRESYGIFA